VDRRRLADWVAGYERAWRTSGTEQLGELFAPDAVYSTGPYEAPHRGLEAIAAMWEAERIDADESFELESEIVAVEGNVGVVRVEVDYGPPKSQQYRDLWVIELDGEGFCTSFAEWPFWPPGTNGAVAGGGDR
jgi:hypothetical protein